MSLIAAASVYAQPRREDTVRIESFGRFLDTWPVVRAPYAGKYEARIGGSSESANDKLRLDIGHSTEIYQIRFLETPHYPRTDREPPDYHGLRIGFNADFFTWTRLRSTASFKFPVEAVDYYFGLGASLRRRLSYGEVDTYLDVRLRVAHISAHLVDGDPSFTDPQQEYFTYSREFADVMVGYIFDMNNGGANKSDDNNGYIRGYAGALAMFHSIPDTLGMVTPYIGVDFAAPLTLSFPVTLKVGYEARLNTELADIGEHQARLGIKLGTVNSRGVTVEGGFFHGRSHYGQHFGVTEEYFTLGFAVDF